ncbi:hypothetical protein [Paracerasibacillus soli]|uniref:Cell division protein FtsL n=1 Tax=Paracerasibacillus soli TaxID=480284 RepID=A0ABU5CQF7_9BACI|nr:hypothetical protein [Virgibacillus soli]MDY0408101.1 hypothetical protein [Virgibacillus soli]
MVLYSSTTDSLNRKLQTLEHQVQQQEVKNAGLQFEIKELSRPERIIKKAKESGLTIQNAEIKKATSSKSNE